MLSITSLVLEKWTDYHILKLPSDTNIAICKRLHSELIDAQKVFISFINKMFSSQHEWKSLANVIQYDITNLKSKLVLLKLTI
jgi:hypothetical protein